MNANSMYEGFFATHKLYYKDGKTVREIEYVNANADVDFRIMVMPNIVIGNNIINVIVEYYRKTMVYTYSVIKDADGWQKHPSYAMRWEKKPYRSDIMTIEQFNRLHKAVELFEIE